MKEAEKELPTESKKVKRFCLKCSNAVFRYEHYCGDCKSKIANQKTQAARSKQRKKKSEMIKLEQSNRVAKIYSNRFRAILKNPNTKRNHAIDLIGCTSEQLKLHLESQFKKWMTWNNYGIKWHVDHITPCSTFDHTDKDQVRRCWHYSNLRPLCAIENIKKSDTIITCQPELLLTLR